MKTKPSKKTADKKKPVKVADKKKPAKRKSATKTVNIKAITRAVKFIQKHIKQDEERQAAINSAAALLRKVGYAFDMGNHLLIINRLKLILAFDMPNALRPGLEKNADVTKHRLLYVEPSRFKNKELTETVMNVVQLQKEQEVKPKATKRLKKLSKPLDRNLAKA